MNAKSPNKSNFLKRRNTGIYKGATKEHCIPPCGTKKRYDTNSNFDESCFATNGTSRFFG